MELLGSDVTQKLHPMISSPNILAENHSQKISLPESVRYQGRYLLSLLRRNHFKVKQVHFIDQSHKLPHNTNKKDEV